MPGFSLLLAGMFGKLMIAPLFGKSGGGLGPARAITAVMLLAALSVVGVGRAALVLFIGAMITHGLTSFSSASFVVVAAATSRFVFLCYVLGVVIWHVSRDPEVTLDMIAGAACAYMLLGVVWAGLYQLVEHARPGSFDIPSSWIPPDRNPQAALMYFSFVTLATVGYGDIKPTDPGIGGLCVAEALVGQLYLAIMIGRMVGLQIARRGV